MTVDEIVKHTFCDVWNDTLKKYKINPTSQVFPRGYVLGGQPGAGKNYLSELANENAIKT